MEPVAEFGSSESRIRQWVVGFPVKGGRVPANGWVGYHRPMPALITSLVMLAMIASVSPAAALLFGLILALFYALA